jgi:fructose-1,6-bisphosphatase/inositol monophosphatase family enzyme
MKLLTQRDGRIIEEILADVARAEIMPRFDGRMVNTTRDKTSAFDVVTEADEAAEAEISRRLLAAFPEAAIIGEEAVSRDPSLLEKIAGAPLAFIIDPIDGTKNYSTGVPAFGVMVSATMNGDVVLGAIHDPVSRTTSMALRGEGAWLRDANGGTRALQVAAPVPLGETQGVVGMNFLPEPLRSTVAKNLSRLGVTCWLRCAAHEYRIAASGQCHILLYNKLMPWDHAAGWLIHQEAGGYSAHFDGTPYKPSHLTGGLLCAPDKASWHEVHEALFTQ